MNDILSQEEIDSLLKKNQDVNETEKEENLNDDEKDLLGEVGNISMATAATTLSTLLGKKVNITTPFVQITNLKGIQESLTIPQVVLQVKFEEGLDGTNVLLMKMTDAAIIANLMMGGDGSQPNNELTEIELSAVSEAMNQMIGSASTSISTMLSKAINIYPPNIQIWNSDEDLSVEGITFDTPLVKTSFRMTVEGLVDSEIMQLFTFDTVKGIVSTMMGEASSVEEEIPVVKEEPKEEIQTVSQPVQEPIEEVAMVKEEPSVIIQKPQFVPLEDKRSNEKPKNIDLILDVPLECSVVLGKTRKTIRDVLALSPGSVIELNKLAEEPLEIYVNGKLIAQGEVVVINENFGIRITNILSATERVQKIK